MDEAKEYQYQPKLTIISGASDLPYGVSPAVSGPTTTSDLSGSATYSYYYTDTNAPASMPPAQAAQNSTKVYINATDSWNVTIGADNSVEVSLYTIINSIRRQDLVGNPNSGGSYGRDIRICRYSGGPILWSINGDPINSNHNLLSSPKILGTEHFTLKPGESASRSSFYIENHTAGVPGPDLPGYWDYMTAGITFSNILPADYRPFSVWTGVYWGSCNRPTGMDAVWTGSRWQEMRTEDGGSGTGNPPLIYTGSRWVNQSKTGQGG